MVTRIILILLLVLLPGTIKVQAGVWDTLKNAFVNEKPKPSTIKVLVAHDKDALTIEVKGRYNIFDPFKETRLGTRFTGKSSVMEPMPGGLKWGEEFPGVYQIQIIPDNPQTSTLVDGIEYRGSIYVYDIGGRLSVVNEVNIEDYLHSLLSLDIDDPLAEEAVAATVIAARTHVYYQATSAKNQFWHVNGRSEGYIGYAVIKRPSGIEKAIDDTKNMVLSRTGAYEGMITPFAISIVHTGESSANRQVATFSLEEANTMAKKGKNAAQILRKAFPNATIELINKETKE